MPLTSRHGTRIYVMARPYVLEPDYTLTIGLYPQPTQQGAIGEVTGTEWVGMRQREIGQAQAWLYPQDRTLILWECYLHDWCREQDPSTDETLRSLWTGFEGFLLSQLPKEQVSQIVTPSWEPIYDDDKLAWPEFLETVGYQQIGGRAFGKEVRVEL